MTSIRSKRIATLSILFFVFTGSLTAQDVVAQHGMVASAHPLASKAGLEILKQGGNAVDAMVATAFALGVVEPNASGIGGGGFMTLRMEGMKEAVTIDFRETAPGAATPEIYYKDKNSFKSLTHGGARAVGVPGVVAGLELALKKYGTMTLAQVIQPAVSYARDGFPVSEKLSGFIVEAYDVISENPATSAVYLQDGLPLPAGAVIKNPDLAATLEKIGKNGSACFYKGEIAKAIAAEMKKLNGLITLEDLSSYNPILKKAVNGTYRGYQIYSTAPPSGGGTHLIELLNILEGYHLKELKHNSAKSIHLLAEALKICLADKAANMADPAFYSVPVKILTGKPYAEGLRKFIDPHKAFFGYKATKMLTNESNSTTHLSVVDEQENMVALTQSLNHWFGSGITVPHTGILLNNHLGDFSSKSGLPNSIAPGKRPVSSIAPTLIYKDDKPYITIGTPGGSRIIGALGQIIVNIIDFGMDIDDAIEAPRVHAYKKTLHVEGRISPTVIKELEKLGHKVKIHPDFDNYFGGAQGILISPKDHRLHGGADSRRDGVVLGY